MLEVLTLFVQHGGRLIDTSPMYGRAQETIGDLTVEAGIEDRLFYATKVWINGAQNGINQMDESLSEMKRKKIDLMQVHNLVDWKIHLETLRQWKSEGKIRYIGITHYSSMYHDQLEKVIREEKIDFVQFNYSIRQRNAEKNLLQTAMEKGVAVIINEPLEKGSLFKLVKGKSLPPWSAEYDIRSWAQFFLKYIIAHPAVTCVIPATSNPANLVDNMSAGHGCLPDEDLKKRMILYLEL